MAEVYVDPERLRKFAQQLKELADFVDGSVDALTIALGRLGGTWRDQEYRAFLQQVQGIQQRLKIFIQETNKVVPMLNKDAEAMDEYRRLQMPS